MRRALLSILFASTVGQASASIECIKYNADTDRVYNAELQKKCAQEEKQQREFDQLAKEREKKNRYFENIEIPKLAEEAENCMLSWTKHYAESTKESTQLVVIAAYNKCLSSAGRYTGVVSTMTGRSERDLSNQFQQKYIPIVIDIRAALGHVPN